MAFDTFSIFKSALEEIFSPSAASVILQSSANKCGRHVYKRITLNVKDDKDVLDYLSHLKESMNWGKISFQDIDFENGTGKITVIDSFECLEQKHTQPSCHFLRGFLAGFLSELFSKDISVTVVKCAGKGDEYCEFAFE